MKTFEDFYAKKDYSNALQTLLKLKSEIPTQDWHYNLGTILAKQEKWAEARLHLLKAQDLGFSGHEVSQNLAIVESSLDVEKLEKPVSGIDYGYKAALYLQDGLLTTLSLVIVVVGLLIIKKQPSFKRFVLMLGLVLIPMSLNFWINSWSQGVVMETTVLNDGPSKIFESHGEIPIGVRVIFDQEDSWLKIVYPSRYQGWVKTGSIRDLESI